jgi:hypothetical protein
MVAERSIPVSEIGRQANVARKAPVPKPTSASERKFKRNCRALRRSAACSNGSAGASIRKS